MLITAALSLLIGKLVVKYVDHGSIVTIDKQREKQLVHVLCELAPMAIQCCLTGELQLDEKG